MRLNIGSGKRVLKGWLNIDRDPAAAKYAENIGADFLRAEASDLPLDDECATEMRAGHILEHMPRAKGAAALKEWRRVLAPGGVAHIEVPDVDECCSALLQAEPAERPRILKRLVGQNDYPGQTHRWGYNMAELVDAAQAAGFHIKDTGRVPNRMAIYVKAMR